MSSMAAFLALVVMTLALTSKACHVVSVKNIDGAARSRENMRSQRAHTRIDIDDLPFNKLQGCSCGHLGDDKRRPWIARVRVETIDEREDGGGHFCTASVLNRLFLITSASCFCDSAVIECGPGRRSVPKVSRGLWNEVAVEVGEGEKTGVEEVIVHEEYVHDERGSRRVDNHNVALIKLVEPLSLRKDVVWPICLPPENENLLPDIDCDFRTVNETSDGNIDCASRTFITGWKPAQGTAKSKVTKCRTDTHGPAVNKECIGECTNDIPPPEPELECLDSDGDHIMEKEASSILNQDTKRILVIDGYKYSYCIHPSTRERSSKFGWCETCLDDCAENNNKTSWGFCLPECQREAGEGVYEFSTYAYIGKTDSNSALGCSFPPSIGLCTGEPPLSPPMQVLWRSEDNGELEVRNTVGPRRIFSDNNDDDDGICHEESGSTVWKKYGRKKAYITGTVSNPEDFCGIFGGNPQRVFSSRTRGYLNWITSKIQDGGCRQN